MPLDIYWKNTEYEILLIDIREPTEIEKAKKYFNAQTIFIENMNVKFISSNMADANVYNYTYDYVIQNNGTLDEFKENIKYFVSKVIQNDKK